MSEFLSCKSDAALSHLHLIEFPCFLFEYMDIAFTSLSNSSGNKWLCLYWFLPNIWLFCIFTLFSLLIISGFKFTVVDEFSHLGLGTVQNIWHQNLWNEHIHGQSLMDNHIYMLSINCWLESWSCSLFNFFFLKKKQLKND